MAFGRMSLSAFFGFLQKFLENRSYLLTVKFSVPCKTVSLICDVLHKELANVIVN